MKNKYFILMVIGFIAGSILTGCNINREKKVEDAQENVDKANQDLKDAQAEYDREWQQFKRDAELKIRANEKSINEIKVEIKTASTKYKIRYEKEIVILEQKNIALKKKIDEYRYEGKDKWEEFKRGFNHEMDVIGKALKDLFTKKD